MHGAVLNTDPDWYDYFRPHGRLDEVNFWQPRGGKDLKALPPLSPVLFRLTMRRAGRPVPSGRIVGFGFFVRRLKWPAWYVWELFGERNGVPSRAAFVERIRRLSLDPSVDVERREVGCLMIAEPTFLPPELSVAPPSDWSPRTMDFKYYDLTAGEGRRVWEQVREAAARARPKSPTLTAAEAEAPGWGEAATEAEAPGWREAMVRVRLGQGTFRAEVIDAYDRACAVTREHSLPVLVAAHIRPYADEGRHDVRNGLALRSDLHCLFDRGYVTFDADHRLVVSGRLRDEFANGATYYALQGRPLALPTDPARRPDPDRLAWHRDKVFERRSA